MRKLALPHDVLMSVDKPARYLGNELNSVHKELKPGMVRYVMCFPDVYDVGMCHLGLPIIYEMLNRREDIWCERLYSPWPDLDRIMRERHIPLFALESQDPVRDFDFLGITLQYEMCYTNILQVLDLAGIPLLAKDRGEDDPIVIGGGPCTYNPEPVADFFDMFYIGEAETNMYDVVDEYKAARAKGLGRREYLRRAASIPGIYVPSLYDVTYGGDGTIASFTPNCPEAPAKVKRVVEMNLTGSYYPEKPIVPFMRIIQDRVTLEIMRGCIRGCRFCQAGSVYKPQREKDLDWLMDLARRMLDETGQEEICLSSLSSSDYSQIEPLIRGLIDECNRRMVNISLPSLRIDEFSLEVMKLLTDVRSSSVTFAPEAGTQRLRDVINKGLTEEDILDGALAAFKAGWNKVKFYFMLGQPTETREDLLGLVDLCEKVAMKYYDEIPKEERQGRIQINASSSFFVPKPFTPFQWATMLHKDEYLERAYIVKDSFKNTRNSRALHYQYNDADITILEGIFARGDRRIAPAILAAYKKGQIYDAWSEYFNYDLWMETFAECGIDVDFYNVRARSLDEILPWDFIDTGVSKSFLGREWEKALRGEVSPNCREKCVGCGARVYGGGVCFEG